MEHRNIVLVVAFAVVVCLGVLVYLFFAVVPSTPTPPEVTEPVIQETSEDDLTLQDFVSGTVLLSSPLVFSGEAEASWFSPEGTFPIEIEDEEGVVLGQGMAEAQGDASGNTRSFTASIPFTVPSGVVSGYVVMRNHNPGGLPQNAAEVIYSVEFVDPEAEPSQPEGEM